MRLPPTSPGSLLALVLLVGCGQVPGSSLTGANPRVTSGYVGNNQPLICTDAPTPVTFEFEYDGDLQTVEATLVGLTTHQWQDIFLTDVVFADHHATLTFTLPVGLPPLTVPPPASRLAAQSGGPITVPSPHVIGQVQLKVRVGSGPDTSEQITGAPVQVIDNCVAHP